MNIPLNQLKIEPAMIISGMLHVWQHFCATFWSADTWYESKSKHEPFSSGTRGKETENMAAIIFTASNTHIKENCLH